MDSWWVAVASTHKLGAYMITTMVPTSRERERTITLETIPVEFECCSFWTLRWSHFLGLFSLLYWIRLQSSSSLVLQKYFTHFSINIIKSKYLCRVNNCLNDNLHCYHFHFKMQECVCPYLKVGELWVIKVRVDVQCGSHHQKRFKLVQGGADVASEAQTPYFQKSLQVK